MPDKRISLQAGSIENGDLARREYHCRFVRSGYVRAGGNRQSKIFIRPDALSNAAMSGLFNGKAVFVDHAGWFDYPSLEKLAGFTSASFYNQIEKSVDGSIKLAQTPTGEVVSQLLDDLLSVGSEGPDVGLSIVFYPQWQEEGDEYHITGIEHVESVDLVFEPAADGRVLQALSSAMAGKTVCKECEAIIPDDGNCFYCETNPSKGVIQMPAQEYFQTPPEQSSPPDLTSNDYKELDWMNALAETTATQMIRASGLPAASQERLIETAHMYTHPDQVTDAIESERNYLAALNADNVIQIGATPPRSPQITGMMNSWDRITQATEALFAGTRPPSGVQPLTGIRELYHLLSGDYEMSGVFQPDRLTLANVTCSTMASLVANVLNKRVVNEFQIYPQWWLPIVSEEDFPSLQQVKWITLGGVGELPTVVEGAAYTELTWDDNYESATFLKKGGYLGLTLEAIDKDDTGRIRAAPRALAQAAWLTLSKAISNIFTSDSGTGPTMTDTYHLFDASNHGNLGTTALSFSEYVAVRTAMRKQTELHSSERLGALTAPRYLLVPPDLEITALQVLASEGQTGTANNDVNPLAEGDSFSARMASARERVIVVDLWTDTNNWTAVCDPRLYPTIGVAYRYGRVPEIFSVASPTAGLMFSNDTMPIKVRFFFAVGPMDYRGMYKENVS